MKIYDESGEITLRLTDEYFYSQIKDKFDHSIKSQSKIFLVVLIPIYAFAFMVFFPGKRFIGEHFILATHFMAALLVYFFVAAYVINIPVTYFLGENHPFTSGIGVLLIILYLTVSFKRFYKVPTWRSVAGGLSIGALTFVIWSAYRMMVFFNIMFWM